MKNPHRLTVLYKKDEVSEVLTARQLSLEDFEAYYITIDLEEVASIETSLVDEKQISILAMKNGFIHNIKMNYEDLDALVVSQCNEYQHLMHFKDEQ